VGISYPGYYDSVYDKPADKVTINDTLAAPQSAAFIEGYIMTATWIAIGYDSAKEYALGDSAEQAQSNYRDAFGPPPLGFFSVIVNADDHAKEYKRAAQALELEGVPVYLAENWVIVAQITDDGLKVLEGKKSPAKLLRQGLVATPDGESEVFTLDAKPHLLKDPSKKHRPSGQEILARRERRKIERQNIQPIDTWRASLLRRRQGWRVPGIFGDLKGVSRFAKVGRLLCHRITG
jgi:hypothetical protein